MKSSLLVPFGLKEDRLYEPIQVDNGKACGCVCPACKKPLVAKQNAQTPHFAHAQDENCARGFETAIHLAVKQIIAERMEVRLPALIWKNPIPRSDEAKLLHKQEVIKLESVVLEQRVDDFIPDIVVIANDTTYLVEVAVTHFIDDEKLRKIVGRKLPTFEIDVSGLKNEFDLTDLEQAIYTSKNYQAEWIYHPRLAELTNETIRAENERIGKIEEEYQEKLRRFETYKNLPPEKKLQINLKSIELTKQQMNALTVFVPWDSSFSTPRIVWQSAVLAYIAKIGEENGLEDGISSFVSSSACTHWLEKVFEVKPKVSDGEKIAVWKYFKHLEKLGILKLLSHREFYIVLGKEKWSSLIIE